MKNIWVKSQICCSDMWLIWFRERKKIVPQRNWKRANHVKCTCIGVQHIRVSRRAYQPHLAVTPLLTSHRPTLTSAMHPCRTPWFRVSSRTILSHGHETSHIVAGMYIYIRADTIVLIRYRRYLCEDTRIHLSIVITRSLQNHVPPIKFESREITCTSVVRGPTFGPEICAFRATASYL